MVESVREPIKTYCSVCNEVIYEDEEYGDHGWEESDLQHDACHAAVQAKERERHLEMLAKLPEMKQSDKWEDRMAAMAWERHQDLAKSIYGTDSGFFGPGKKS